MNINKGVTQMLSSSVFIGESMYVFVCVGEETPVLTHDNHPLECQNHKNDKNYKRFVNRAIDDS